MATTTHDLAIDDISTHSYLATNKIYSTTGQITIITMHILTLHCQNYCPNSKIAQRRSLQIRTCRSHAFPPAPTITRYITSQSSPVINLYLQAFSSLLSLLSLHSRKLNSLTISTVSMKGLTIHARYQWSVYYHGSPRQFRRLLGYLPCFIHATFCRRYFRHA